MYPQIIHAAALVDTWVFTPKGATNLKIILFGLSAHIELHMSFRGLYWEFVSDVGYFVSLQASEGDEANLNNCYCKDCVISHLSPTESVKCCQNQ